MSRRLQDVRDSEITSIYLTSIRLTAGEDHHGSFEIWRTPGLRPEGEHLSKCCWHLVGLRMHEHLDVEIAWFKESILVAAHIGPSEISCRIVAKSCRLVHARHLPIHASRCRRNIGSILGVACQDDTIADLRMHSYELVG